MDADTTEKVEWVLEFEYDYKCDWIKEWGKVHEKSPEYTFKSSMSIEKKQSFPIKQ